MASFVGLKFTPDDVKIRAFMAARRAREAERLEATCKKRSVRRRCTTIEEPPRNPSVR